MVTALVSTCEMLSVLLQASLIPSPVLHESGNETMANHEELSCMECEAHTNYLIVHVLSLWCHCIIVVSLVNWIG